MFAPLGVTTLVLVAGVPWVLPAAAGRTILKPPQNVEVDITDETFTLRWNRSSSESVGNVTFSAHYRIPDEESWMELPGCRSITSTQCDLSSLEREIYENVQLRVRAEEGSNTSPWRELDPFVPFQQVHIGPPIVHLEAEDKAITVNISPPGAKGRLRWLLDGLSFVYSVVIWKNGSGAQTRNETFYPRIKIYKLSPETTYCVKVKASLLLLRNPSSFSPERCVTTTAKNELPPPENIRVVLENQTNVLRWDYTQDNVTFHAQWMHSYLKRIPGSNSEKWVQVPHCEHLVATRCVLPWEAFPGGGYFLRVRATRGDSVSFWSEEEKFDVRRQTAIPPPVLTLKPLGNNSLQVCVGPQDPPEFQPFLLTYEVIFWENTSNMERSIIENRTDFTIPSLKPLAVYCARARAWLEGEPLTSLSRFSDTTCVQMKAGDAPWAWLIAGICAAAAVPFVVYAAAMLVKLVSYVFFPSREPPSTIHEYFPEQPVKNLLLCTSEERTERCFIIENIDTVSAGGTEEADDDHKTYSSQTSQDSGHYSLEEESGGGTADGALGQGEAAPALLVGGSFA